MGLPVFKDCCCLELKWGALIVAIIDLIFAGAAGGGGGSLSGTASILWMVCLVIHVAHIVACILVIVSVFKPNKNFVVLYLITGLLRIIIDIVFLIYLCVAYKFSSILVTAIILIISIVIGCYFWLVIYSWYRKLGGSTPAD
ncbi:uncharacterized protein LOC110189772 [Drosophila serrata]|uniref:uncharacterized protein LOC110189772 n=1 Tax=Drosophila serrata TaxID=7274 RepID=UPI000A1D1EA2|nr:uncharacterized protein LOC110189772 [Drosophila serrata]